MPFASTLPEPNPLDVMLLEQGGATSALSRMKRQVSSVVRRSSMAGLSRTAMRRSSFHEGVAGSMLGNFAKPTMSRAAATAANKDSDDNEGSDDVVSFGPLEEITPSLIKLAALYSERREELIKVSMGEVGIRTVDVFHSR